jgi:hypothetical protein
LYIYKPLTLEIKSSQVNQQVTEPSKVTQSALPPPLYLLSKCFPAGPISSNLSEKLLNVQEHSNRMGSFVQTNSWGYHIHSDIRYAPVSGYIVTAYGNKPEIKGITNLPI